MRRRPRSPADTHQTPAIIYDPFGRPMTVCRGVVVARCWVCAVGGKRSGQVFTVIPHTRIHAHTLAHVHMSVTPPTVHFPYGKNVSPFLLTLHRHRTVSPAGWAPLTRDQPNVIQNRYANTLSPTLFNLVGKKQLEKYKRTGTITGQTKKSDAWASQKIWAVR